MYSIEAIGRRCFVEANEKNARSPLLTVRQVSEWPNVSPSWVRDHATKRHRPALPSMKLSRCLRFREDQLAEWIRQLSEHAPNFAQKNPVRTQPQGEAFDLLQLLNTGHAGTLATLHANSAGQALARFTTCVLQSGIDLPCRAIRSNIAEALNLLVHIERRHGQRLVRELYAIRRYDPALDRYDLEALYEGPEQAATRAVAGQYVTYSFEASDHLAIVLKNNRTSSVIQRIAMAQTIAANYFQSWLSFQNSRQYEVYISMNALERGGGNGPER